MKLAKRAGGQEWLDEFSEALKDFIKVSNFQEFLSNHKTFYKKMEEDTKWRMSKIDYVKTLEEYYHKEYNSYNFILGLVCHGGGYSIRLKKPNGKLDVYYIGGA